MADWKPYAATDENLIAHGLAPAMRWLVAVALDGTDMTYGRLRKRLENEVGFSPIFTTRTGIVAGELMNAIQAVEPDAPLINVLVVNKNDHQPSDGAGWYMGERFSEPLLKQKHAKEKYPILWEKTFKRAVAEVYRYEDAQWADLYERVFSKRLDIKQIRREREQRHKGTENDGIPSGRRYGPGGEGPLHEALRLWVKDNPAEIRKYFKDASTETEVDLDSGDRVDVVYKVKDRIVVLEVKSRISDELDLRRGVFQCVKYRAVRRAMDVRDDAIVEAYLVTENPLPNEIAALVKRHDIHHIQVPQDRN
ncbi:MULTISPECIES: hypothetical protein [unclassified Bradyrhizobium]|uniref:hypothetical protein n=1 Tax=unclassified Bradyrhizobium TaxID=2631580 RepID=UPI0028ECA64D|nr:MULTISPECIES: hypothetical protein [unclassified Bradyrhizobium]